MRIVLTISLILLFSSCQVLKKKHRSSSRTTQETYHKIDINHEKDLEKLSDLTERVNIRREAVSVIEIKPVGSFTISPDGTYTGEGGSVFIQNTAVEDRDESKTLVESERDNSRVQESLEEQTSSLDEEQTLSMDVQKKSSIKGYVGVGIAILIVIIGFLLARKFKII